MPKHVHADLMMEYAKDTAESSTPWKGWEYAIPGGEWRDLNKSPAWNVSHEYRRKQKTIQIGDFDVPESLRVPPEEGTDYYTPCTSFALGYYIHTWDGGDFDLRQLENGLAHLTKEAAITHAKAIISLTKAK